MALQLPKSADMDIVLAELGLFPVGTEALILQVGLVQHISKMKDARLAKVALKQMEADDEGHG